MSIVNNTSIILPKIRSASGTLSENNDENNSQENIIFLQELPIKPRPQMNTNNNNTSSIPDRTPANLLELKQQRLSAAADRKKRIITRIISIVGLLIILLCAVIVTLTLKMAPKIDELVRTKTGPHQTVHFISRLSTPLTTTTIIELNNFTTNYSLITKSSFHTRRKSFI